MQGFTIGPARAEDIPALESLLAALFSIEVDFRPDGERQRRGLALLLGRRGAGGRDDRARYGRHRGRDGERAARRLDGRGCVVRVDRGCRGGGRLPRPGNRCLGSVRSARLGARKGRDARPAARRSHERSQRSTSTAVSAGNRPSSVPGAWRSRNETGARERPSSATRRGRVTGCRPTRRAASRPSPAAPALPGRAARPRHPRSCTRRTPRRPTRPRW